MRYSPQLPSLHSAIATDVSAGIRASEHKTKTSAWSVVALTMACLSVRRLQAAWLLYRRVCAYAERITWRTRRCKHWKAVATRHTVGATCLQFCRGATEKRRKIHLRRLLHLAVIRLCTELHVNGNHSGYLFSLAAEITGRQYCLDVFLQSSDCHLSACRPPSYMSNFPSGPQNNSGLRNCTVHQVRRQSSSLVCWSLAICQNQSDTEVLVQDICGHICCTESQFCILVACLNLKKHFFFFSLCWSLSSSR